MRRLRRFARAAGRVLTFNLSQRGWFVWWVLHCALNTALGIIGASPVSWWLSGLSVGMAMLAFVLWRRDVREARAAEDLAEEFEAATWTCPDCKRDVPVMATCQQMIVATLDPTDIHAHLLIHQGAGS